LATVADAATASGLVFLEVAMNTGGAADQIRLLRDRLDVNCHIGAGTALAAAQAREAVAAGYHFGHSSSIFEKVLADPFRDVG